MSTPAAAGPTIRIVFHTLLVSAQRRERADRDRPGDQHPDVDGVIQDQHGEKQAERRRQRLSDQQDPPVLVAIRDGSGGHAEDDGRKRRRETDHAQPFVRQVQALVADHEPAHADEAELQSEDARQHRHPEAPVVGIGKRAPARGFV
jgi:hypothetical protein